MTSLDTKLLSLAHGSYVGDFAICRFWEQIAFVAMSLVAGLIREIAVSEEFARKKFNDYSATARLRRIKSLCESSSVVIA